MTQLKFTLYMEKVNVVGTIYFNKYYNEHKKHCIEKTDSRAVFQEIEEDNEKNRKKLDFDIKQIEKSLPLINQMGVAFSWKIEKI